MKKAIIIFAILFVLTLAIPAIAILRQQAQSNAQELVTIFDSTILLLRCHLHF